MEKVVSKIADGLSSKFKPGIKSVLSITRGEKSVEIIVLAKVEDYSEVYEAAYSLAKSSKTKTDISVLDAEEFFEKIMDNDIVALKKLRKAEICKDSCRFITPIKTLVDSGKVFGQKDTLETTASARARYSHIDILKHDAIRNLYGAVITSANAALLARGYSLPPIRNLPGYLKECFVKHDLLEKKYIKICNRVIDTYKKVQSGKQFDLWGFSQLSYETELFIERMKSLVR